MNSTEIIRLERAEIGALVRTEAARETQRRNRPVSVHDPVVQLLVADRILHGAGRALRIKHDRPAGDAGHPT